MGTNYYANWNPPGAENVAVRLHICKSFTSFNGLVFPTWQDWKKFLIHNFDAPDRTKWFTGGGSLRIVDEYGVDHGLDGFIQGVESTTQEQRRRHTQYMIDNSPVHGVIEYDPDVDWFDPEGFSFHRGEFR